MSEKGSRKKKILRVLTASLAICQLFTYPNIQGSLSVVAAAEAAETPSGGEGGEGGGTETANPTSGTCGESVTWNLDETTGTLTISGTGNMSDYSKDVPAPWNDNCASIKSVVINNGVTSIGKYAFYKCTALTGSITIPDSVTSIGACAFYMCNALTDVTIPNTVTSIGGSAFYDCNGLTSIIIPDSVTSIGGSAFSSCANLASVTLPTNESFTTIQPQMFNGCHKLESITIPDSVTKIQQWAFQSTGLTEITIPNTVTSIESDVFNTCSKLAKVTLPTNEKFTTISSHAFCNCYNLKEINIPSNVTKISGMAFSNSGLTSITIPDTVTSIDYYAFSGCSSLTSITLPNNITSIGTNTFAGCKKLASITIPNTVTAIGQNAFENCTALERITIPNAVKYLNMNAFSGCSKLESVTLPTNENFKTIYESTFKGCSALTDIDIPNSVTKIGNSAFYGCKALTSITIPDTVESIGEKAFSGCGNLASVKFPTNDKFTTIPLQAFYDCKALTGITIPDTVTSLVDQAFENCTALKDVTIPGKVTEIGVGAFVNCCTLKTVEFKGTTAPTFDADVFKNCSALETITIPCGWDKASLVTTLSVTENQIDQKPHQYHTNEWASDETNHWIKCENCETTKDVATHTWNEGVVTTEPTCTEKGEKTYTCTVCNGIKTEPTEATGQHNNTYTAKDAVITETCSNTGCTHSATATLTLKDGADLTYTGSEMDPYTVDCSEGWAGGVLTIAYSKTPKDVGEYTASISVGNATASTTFSITQKDLTPQPLPDNKSLTDYVTIDQTSIVGGADNLYSDNITITPKDGYQVGLSPDNLNGVTISEETGSNGDKKTIYIKAPDGTIYETEFTYKLDKSAPTVDLKDMDAGTGSTVLDNQIIGKKDMVIKIPASGITDTVSDIAEVSYTATPDGGGTAKTGTLTLNGDNYEIALSEIAADGEFVGTIVLTVKDSAGHTTTVTVPAEGGKIIVEEHKPTVEAAAPDSSKPNDNGWYNENFEITVTVTDNKDSDNADILSGGIAKIEWKDGKNGEVHTVTVPTESGIVGTQEFTIPTSDGEHTYYVNVVDNAGNESGWQEYAAVKVDTQKPDFNGELTVTDKTKDGANISFTPTEGGKVYWIVSDTELTAEQVKEQSIENGSVLEITSDTEGSIAITGLTGEEHTVYVVLEDVAGNLSEVKKETFTTQHEAPEIPPGNLDIDYSSGTITLPADIIGQVEVYTDPSDPEGSKITPDADGTLPVEPGTTVYIRYPEEDGTPASGVTEIQIPDRPAAPEEKQVTVTSSTITVASPSPDEEYVLVEKGQTPDWSNANTTGEFTGLTPGKEYELYVRTKATENSFASESVKTEILAHDHTSSADWLKDADYHWHECSICGVELDKTAHTSSGAATEDTAETCTECGYVIAPATGHITHTADTSKWLSDETNHWHKCVGCDEKLDVAAHSGGTATCTDKALCEVCGTAHGDVDSTNHTNTAAEWSKDETGHWHECSDCGADLDKAAHTSSGAAAPDKAETCTVCGYEIAPATGYVADPTFTPESGSTFTSREEVTIVCATEGAEIYYTIDGTDPTTASTKYEGAFTITKTTTVKAIAVKNGMGDSKVVSATFTKRSSSGSGGSGYRPGRPSYPSNPAPGNPTPENPSPEPPANDNPTHKNPSIDNIELSEDEIVTQINDLSDGGELTIDMNGNTTVSAEVKEAIENKNAVITFVVDTDISIIVDGSEIAGNPSAIDLSVGTSETTLSTTNFSAIGGTAGKQFTLGEIGIHAKVDVASDKTNAGKFASLMKLNQETGKYEFISVSKIDADGRVLLDTNGKGDHLMIIDSETKKPGDLNNDMLANAMDAAELLKSIVYELSMNGFKADYNGDGKINALDASEILKVVVGLVPDKYNLL